MLTYLDLVTVGVVKERVDLLRMECGLVFHVELDHINRLRILVMASGAFVLVRVHVFLFRIGRGQHVEAVGCRALLAEQLAKLSHTVRSHSKDEHL